MKKITIPLNQLLVNHQNPRFEPVKSELQAIDLMISKIGVKIYNLAKDIAEHGLNPSKRLMVINVDDNKYVSLEGNRRLVALKLLHQPDLIKDDQLRQKFVELKMNSGTSLLSEIDCAVFNDRESAYRWVNLEHTGLNDGVGILGWDSEQRQRFIAQYSGKKLSRSVQLMDYAEDNGISNEKIDSTTLDRLLATAKIREFIGVDFPNGILNITKPANQFVDNLWKLFTGMSTDEFSVQDVYTTAKAIEWVSNILGIKKESTDNQKQKKSKKNKKTAGTSTQTNPLDGDWISNRLFSVYPHNNRVNSILGELKDIKPSKKPNVCATSLRVLLELTLYVYLEEKGAIKEIIEQKKRNWPKKIKEGALHVNWIKIGLQVSILHFHI